MVVFTGRAMIADSVRRALKLGGLMAGLFTGVRAVTRVEDCAG